MHKAWKRTGMVLGSCVIFLSGCSLTHNVTMTKRLSYQAERDLASKQSPVIGVASIGHVDNENLTLKRNNNGFVGSGRMYIYDVGLTFNQLVEQASRVIEPTCVDVNCHPILLRLKDTDLQYTVGWDQWEKTEFKTTIQFFFPSNCSYVGPVSLEFQNVLHVETNEVFSSDRTPLMIPIENVINQALIEGRRLFEEGCSI